MKRRLPQIKKQKGKFTHEEHKGYQEKKREEGKSKYRMNVFVFNLSAVLI